MGATSSIIIGRSCKKAPARGKLAPAREIIKKSRTLRDWLRDRVSVS